MTPQPINWKTVRDNKALTLFIDDEDATEAQ